MPETVDTINRSTADDDAVLELVHAVMHSFRSQQYHASGEGDDGITHMESKVLAFFARHPGATQRDLVLHSGRDKAQLARLIAGVRQRGLLSGEADPADRRNVRLQLTEAGRAVQRTLQRRARRLEGQAVAGLNGDQRRQLVALLKRVRANLERPRPSN